MLLYAVEYHCSVLVQVLSRFPLNHSEIVQRRQLQSTRAKPEEGTVSFTLIFFKLTFSFGITG